MLIISTIILPPNHPIATPSNPQSSHPSKSLTYVISRYPRNYPTVLPIIVALIPYFWYSTSCYFWRTKWSSNRGGNSFTWIASIISLHIPHITTTPTTKKKHYFIFFQYILLVFYIINISRRDRKCT